MAKRDFKVGDICIVVDREAWGGRSASHKFEVGDIVAIKERYKDVRNPKYTYRAEIPDDDWWNMRPCDIELLVPVEDMQPKIELDNGTTLRFRQSEEGKTLKGDTCEHFKVGDPISEIIEERGKDYGPVKENFERVRILWDAYIMAKYQLDVDDFPDSDDVANMMILLKMARLMHKYKKDTVDDIAGYAKCLNMLHEEE